MNEVRYIDVDEGDDTSHPPMWRLRVGGVLVATERVADWRQPPPSLTQGFTFTPQYHSAESAEADTPDSWICNPSTPV